MMKTGLGLTSTETIRQRLSLMLSTQFNVLVVVGRLRGRYQKQLVISTWSRGGRGGSVLGWQGRQWIIVVRVLPYPQLRRSVVQLVGEYHRYPGLADRGSGCLLGLATAAGYQRSADDEHDDDGECDDCQRHDDKQYAATDITLLDRRQRFPASIRIRAERREAVPARTEWDDGRSEDAIGTKSRCERVDYSSIFIENLLGQRRYLLPPKSSSSSSSSLSSIFVYFHKYVPLFSQSEFKTSQPRRNVCLRHIAALTPLLTSKLLGFNVVVTIHSTDGYATIVLAVHLFSHTYPTPWLPLADLNQ